MTREEHFERNLAAARALAKLAFRTKKSLGATAAWSSDVYREEYYAELTRLQKGERHAQEG